MVWSELKQFRNLPVLPAPVATSAVINRRMPSSGKQVGVFGSLVEYVRRICVHLQAQQLLSQCSTTWLAPASSYSAWLSATNPASRLRVCRDPKFCCNLFELAAGPALLQLVLVLACGQRWPRACLAGPPSPVLRGAQEILIGAAAQRSSSVEPMNRFGSLC